MPYTDRPRDRSLPLTDELHRVIQTCLPLEIKLMNRVSWLFKRLSFGCVSLAVLLCVERAEAQSRVAPVIVAPVIQRQAASGQTFVGTVMPLKKSAVGTAVDGRVTEFPINEGDRVTKGQPLAKLLTETISLQIVAAQAELKFREEELRELANGWRKEEVEQAAAKMEAARSRREYAGQRLKRTLALFEKGQVGTREQMEEDSSAAVYAQQTYEAERLGHELMKQGPRPERIEQSKARVAEQTALVQQLQDQLKKHTMIAPFDGYIVAERTEIGEWVTKGQVVAEVIYLDEIDIEAHVLDTHIEHVRVGTTVRVEVPALKSSIFVGEVAIITPQADTKSRTFPVKVRVKNVIRDDGPLLKAGMLARVTLPTGELRDSLLVPKDAIVLGGATPVVASVVALDDKELAALDPKAPGPKPTSKVKFVPVELGIADGAWIAVTGQLAADQHVVIVGNERVMPGQMISIIEVRKAPVADAAAKNN